MSSATSTPMKTRKTGLLHEALVKLASWALWSFFREVRVINEHNLPRQGSVIVASTHHNSALDPTTLSTTYPSGRRFHYWVKSSLFKNPILASILLDAGNISVDRDNKDKRKLFQGTFDALEVGDAVAVFPEGTSYTQPHIVQVKDGAAWSALEYTLLVREAKAEGRDLPPVIIVPAAISYTNKSKYRSAVILQFGTPIDVEPYMEGYVSKEEGAARAATKRLTAEIERQMLQMSVNAPDWETLFAARMAREILWENEREMNLNDFVDISQTLVDLFTTPYASARVETVKSRLLTYFALLKTSHLTHEVLSDLPLPHSLDPRRTSSVPSRIFTLSLLLWDSIICLVQLPFFFLPLLIHLPVYLVGKYVARIIEDEEEVAQGKVFLGLFLLMMTYSVMFFCLWAFFWLGGPLLGAVLAAALTWGFAVWHVSLVDDNYQSAKKLLAAWRILLGVWAPQSWDVALPSLQLSVIPEQNVNQYLKQPASATTSGSPQPPTSPAPPSPTPGPKKQKKPVPPPRRLVRHVLRSRVVAVQALSRLLADLERDDGKVTASPHLARSYGHGPASSLSDSYTSPDDALKPIAEHTTSSATAVPEGNGWRSAREVVAYLRARGAKLDLARRQDDFGVLSSEGEELDGDGDGGMSTEAEGTAP